MKNFNSTIWLRLSILNLLFVALLGLLMRYKIGFEFPYFDQKHIQHAHSHFAFAGWITHTIMTLMINAIEEKLNDQRIKTYIIVLAANLLCAYGMLVSFAIQGYGLFSISFSTASILAAFTFSWLFIKDVWNEKQMAGRLWFITALLWGILSSLGTFALSYMMATKQIAQHSYLASVYWYLHFQYNGWFFFACMGLFVTFLHKLNKTYLIPEKVFWIFAASCIPAYGLSILWLELPIWAYTAVVLAAFAQLIGWILLLRKTWDFSLVKHSGLSIVSKSLFALLAISITVKIALQLGSTIPSVSKLAFGFRPIVIAYLHLVLLAIISLFLLSYIYANHLLRFGKVGLIGFLVFVAGVYLNEIMLAVQGIASFSYTVIPGANEMLFAIAVMMFSGLLLLSLNQIPKKTK